MVYADPHAWIRDRAVIGVISGVALALLILLVLLLLWAFKSRHRRWEKLMRRRSVRSSARSTRSLMAASRSGSAADVNGGRRNKQNVSVLAKDCGSVGTEWNGNGNLLFCRVRC